MGIDPGLANTGFGVVRSAGGRLGAVDGGVIETSPDQPLESRLAHVHAELEKLIAWHEPAAVALEELYFGANARSATAIVPADEVARTRHQFDHYEGHAERHFAALKRMLDRDEPDYAE